MKKSKKTRKADASALSPQEQASLDALLGDLSRVEPSRLAEQVSGPHFAEALVNMLPAEDPATPGILLALRPLFHEKSVQKAIKKAAFRLRQKGIGLPEERDSAAPVLRPGIAAESDSLVYLGPMDGTGSRPVFISIPQLPAGVDVAIGVVNDEEGIREFTFARHSRKRMKEIKEIFFSRLPHMVETSLSHAADVLERAYRVHGPGVNDSTRPYLRLRPWLREHTSRIETPVVYHFLPLETISSDLLTESQVQRLFGHELMASWIIDRQRLRPLMEEIRKAEESRIFISEGQRLEHIHRIKVEGIVKLFPEARRRTLKYRLEEMAYVFYRSGEESLARVCLAVSFSLAQEHSPIRINPFLKILVERSLLRTMKNAKSPGNASAPQSQRLIIT